MEEAPYPKSTASYVIIKTKAVAVNPANRKLQAIDRMNFHYPRILGSYVSGKVIELGESVEVVQVGDRVLTGELTLVVMI